jgi:predicted Zn-dependent protease
MIWTSQQARELTDRVLARSKADEMVVTVDGDEQANVRFARNTATTSGASSNTIATITASFGKRSGIVTLGQFDEASIERAVRKAEEMARLSRENPEAMPVLGSQTIAPGRAWFDDVAGATPEWRASSVRTAIELSKKRGLIAAGFVETQAGMQAIASSKGLFVYDRYTSAGYSLTARTEDGTGSGWASAAVNELRQLDAAKLATVAIEKAAQSRSPVAIEPGKYTVVLEPAAVSDLLGSLIFAADARQTDEGRSCYSKKGGGNRVGELIVDEKMQIYSDPDHSLAPTMKFASFGPPAERGLPLGKNVWVERGVLKGLMYTRFWAQKMAKAPNPFPANLIMDGGTATMEDLIAGTERGLLVTRFWYVRMLDPQALMLTGLTRDGLFLIEKGRVTRPVRNLRWNESPIVAFNNLDAMTPARRAGGGASQFSLVCPAVRIREFTFTSSSDAI